MFYGCSSLKELNLSNFNTSKMTSMQRMFDRCESLEELIIQILIFRKYQDWIGYFLVVINFKN